MFGVSDDRFGQSVAAVVAVSDAVTETDLINHVRVRLAAYKAPRAIVSVAVAPRAVNGKADYAAARAVFSEARQV